jgi:lipopolysaccharide biosynthesis glycosyltransferase
MARNTGASCSIYDVAAQLNRFPSLTGKFHYSRATYGRLFIADLLPNDIEWVIYLDCDILCVGSLSELWNRRQGVATAAAVPDVWVNSDPAYKESVGCDPNSVYYNCGVMLINAREWRARHIFPALIEFLSHNPSLRYVDQDAVNSVLGRELLELEPYWNVFISAPDSDQVATALDAAVNIHYCAALKPWHLGYSICGGIAGDRYRAAKAVSPWRWQFPDPQLGRLKKRIREKIGSFR